MALRLLPLLLLAFASPAVVVAAAVLEAAVQELASVVVVPLAWSAVLIQRHW